MYAECCGYILMSASALCIHVGMSACFARPFVHQSVASVRLSVRLMIVQTSLCSSFYLPSAHLSDIPSVYLYVCLYVCSHVPSVEKNVLVYVLWTSKIELT